MCSSDLAVLAACSILCQLAASATGWKTISWAAWVFGFSSAFACLAFMSLFASVAGALSSSLETHVTSFVRSAATASAVVSAVSRPAWPSFGFLATAAAICTAAFYARAANKRAAAAVAAAAGASAAPPRGGLARDDAYGSVRAQDGARRPVSLAEQRQQVSVEERAQALPTLRALPGAPTDVLGGPVERSAAIDRARPNGTDGGA